MARRNVTVAIDEDLLKEARHLAVEKGVSLSTLLAQTIEGIVRGGGDYEGAKKRAMEMMRNPPDLGTKGRKTWTRDDVHER